MKIKRVIAFLAGVLLIVLLFYAYSEFNGNPFVKIMAKQKINHYLTSHFTELDYSKSSIHFNFKDGTYYMYIDVNNSEDNDFTISYRNGEIDNNYESRVLLGDNIFNRLQTYLNDDKWEIIIRNIVGDNLSFALITVNEAKWAEHLPEPDTSIEDMLKTYPLEMTVYLQHKGDLNDTDIEALKSQIYEDFKKENMELSKIIIMIEE